MSAIEGGSHSAESGDSSEVSSSEVSETSAAETGGEASAETQEAAKQEAGETGGFDDDPDDVETIEDSEEESEESEEEEQDESQDVGFSEEEVEGDYDQQFSDAGNETEDSSDREEDGVGFDDVEDTSENDEDDVEEQSDESESDADGNEADGDADQDGKPDADTDEIEDNDPEDDWDNPEDEDTGELEDYSDEKTPDDGSERKDTNEEQESHGEDQEESKTSEAEGNDADDKDNADQTKKHPDETRETKENPEADIENVEKPEPDDEDAAPDVNTNAETGEADGDIDNDGEPDGETDAEDDFDDDWEDEDLGEPEDYSDEEMPDDRSVDDHDADDEKTDGESWQEDTDSDTEADGDMDNDGEPDGAEADTDTEDGADINDVQDDDVDDADDSYDDEYNEEDLGEVEQYDEDDTDDTDDEVNDIIDESESDDENAEDDDVDDGQDGRAERPVTTDEAERDADKKADDIYEDEDSADDSDAEQAREEEQQAAEEENEEAADRATEGAEKADADNIDRSIDDSAELENKNLSPHNVDEQTWPENTDDNNEVDDPNDAAHTGESDADSESDSTLEAADNKAEISDETRESLGAFEQNRWDNLSQVEKEQAVEKLRDSIAEDLQLENKPGVAYYNKADTSDYGGYAASTNTIYINRFNMDDAAETADTIAHESRHCWQHERAENPQTEQDYRFKENFEDYTRPEENFEEYLNQPVETDARDYANRVRSQIPEDVRQKNYTDNTDSNTQSEKQGDGISRAPPEHEYQSKTVSELPDDFEGKQSDVERKKVTDANYQELREVVGKSAYDRSSGPIEFDYKGPYKKLTNEEKSEVASQVKELIDSKNKEQLGDFRAPTAEKIKGVREDGSLVEAWEKLHPDGTKYGETDGAEDGTRHMETPAKGEVIDRIGAEDGNYFSPMDENGKPYSLKSRGIGDYLPNENISENASYHAYEIQRDFTKENFQDAIQNSELSDGEKDHWQSRLDAYYQNCADSTVEHHAGDPYIKTGENADGVKTGTVAPMFTLDDGGAKQYITPFNAKELKQIGMIKDVE